MLATRRSAEPPAWTEELLASSRVTVPTLLVRGGKSDIVDDEGVAEPDPSSPCDNELDSITRSL